MSDRGRAFLSNVPLADALAAWAAARTAAGCPTRVETERVALPRAAGRVTAAPVWALRSSPPFDAAAMDGIAVRAADTVGASDVTPLRLGPDDFAVVDTGDPLPAGFDAIIMREQVAWLGEEVELRAAAAVHQHVRPIGEDIAATELLLPEGHTLRPVDVAAAAAAGLDAIDVRRRPVVAVLPTGDEVVPLGVVPGPGELLDTNSLMLTAQAEEAGCEAVALPIAPDDPERIAAALRGACVIADLVLVIAGSSAGRDDHTASVLRSLGTLAVHGVAVKPGHPVALGVVNGTPVIGVPGYPVSAALTFELFAAPFLADLAGREPAHRARGRARLARAVPSHMGMEDWVRVRLGRVRGSLVAAPLSRAAGVLTSLVRADGLLRVAAELEGIAAGEEVEVELLRSERAIERTLVVVGSHDPALDLAASLLRARNPGFTLATAAVGSLGGLTALRDGLCHIAGSHLLDPETGVYTLPWVERALPGREVAVIRLAHREQGLIVPPGNPLGLAGSADLARDGVTFVNRQRGAGTRVLLDHLLAREGIDPVAIAGYGREASTHLQVAAAVAAGSASCGLGVLSAARAFGLGFVPIAHEPFDLVLDVASLDDPVVTPLLALLGEVSFRAELEALGGYDASETGRRIR
ncbi:MAG: molybdopterin biosynthesis protein [Thermoleophilia bacterium]|nr:molybdopterin biosynthesis protein [Thermoleophilia bacterium]